MNSEEAIFEIHDPEINIKELMEEIEKNISKRNISTEDIEELSNFNLSKDNAYNLRDFDPSYTAHLFESGINPPKFTNPRYWFIKGPIKKLLVWTIDFYSNIERKLSNNRIKAFYSLIYEVMILRNRLEKTNNQILDLQKELMNLKTYIHSGDYKFYSKLNEPQEEFVSEDEFLLDKLSMSDSVLIILPDSVAIHKKLKLKGIRHLVVIQKNFLSNPFGKNSAVKVASNLLDFNEFESWNKIVIDTNLCLLPNWYIESLLNNLKSHTEKGTKVFMKFSNVPTSKSNPFIERYITYIDENLLHNYLRDLGFYNIIVNRKNNSNLTVISFYV